MPNGQLRNEYEPQAHKFVEVHYLRIRSYASFIVKRSFPNRVERIDDITHDVIADILEGRHNIQFHKAPLTYVQFLLRNAHNRQGNLKKDQIHNHVQSLEEELERVQSQDDLEDGLE